MLDMDKSIELKKELTDIDTVCQLEFSGSTTLKDLHILVTIKNVHIIYYINNLKKLACEHFDGGSNFMRVIGPKSVADLPAEDSSPHLTVTLVEK